MKILNFLKGRWPQFKREFFSIIFLSIFSLWWIFNFPSYVWLGTPWSIFVGVAISIIAIVSLLYLFLFPEKSVFKSRHGAAWYTAAYHIMILLVWYYDLYGMPNRYYLLLYVYWLMIDVLLIRAVKRHIRRLK